MTNDEKIGLSRKYCRRFGKLAVEFAFVTQAQVSEAFARQAQEDREGIDHRWLGEILFEEDAMTAPQIDTVMTELLKRMRQEETSC